MITITVLNDNRPAGNLGSEHGLSMMVEADETILFDTGPSDIILRNAEKLGIDLRKIPKIVLSHGHYDHGNGLAYLAKTNPKQKLICHPAVFDGKYRKGDHSYIGLPLSRTNARQKFELTETKQPLDVSEKIIFLGEIPRINDFEAKTTAFEKEDGSEDFIQDDSGIAIKTSRGLIVITGCGHAGICNTLEQARKVTGENRILAALGGFHLKYDNEVTRRVVECFVKMEVEKAYPSHCTELPALVRFYEQYKNNFVRSGDVFRFED